MRTASPPDLLVLHAVRVRGMADAGAVARRYALDRNETEELDATGARPAAEEAHALFEPLNERFLAATTAWQIRPTPWEAMAANDHTDWRWDGRVVDRLGALHRRMEPVCELLAARLERFDGHPDRYRRSLARAEHGDPTWVDRPGIDSCHTVWFELHENLLSTLGLERGGAGGGSSGS